MRKLLVVFVLLLTTVIVAQEKGTIVGTVTDKEMNNEPLPFANVFVKGTTVGTTTDFDGKYILSVGEGSVVVVFSFIGYKAIEVPVNVVAGKTQTINQLLSASEGVTMDEVMVRATVSREKESALLLEQKKAVAMTTAIGAQELSRKGVSNVAAAVTKVAGVTKQEGGSGSIFVRGLGDRYNVTTLNGLPLPSNNPANKNISLDIFSTDIVEVVGISKTFESQNYADFGGANINIVSKKFRGSPYVSIGFGLGGNTNVLGVDKFYLQDGPSYFGLNSVTIPGSPLRSGSHTTSWDRVARKNTLNNSFSLSGGKKFEIGDESSLSTFITASFDADNKFIEGVSRGSITAQGTVNSDFYKKSFKYNTNTTVMGTANYRINSDHSILFTSLFLNSSSQDYSEYVGTNQNYDGGSNGGGDISGFVKRGTFDKTKLYVNQLLGKHKLKEQFVVNWAIAYSFLNNEIPDRMQNTFVPSRDGSNNYTFFTDSPIDNHRYFQNLEEEEYASNVSVSYDFNKNEEDAYKGKVTLGYSGKSKDVKFNSNQFSFFPSINKFNFPKGDIHNVDGYFNAANFNAADGDVVNHIPQLYQGSLKVNALFVNLQYKITDKLTAIVGARMEQVDQDIAFVTSLKPNGAKSNFSENKFLPSLISKYKVSDKQNLKFAFSQTYTLPQFKEKVQLLFEEVTQGYEGNPNLYESTNYNVDLGWELFPERDELISVTTFGKLIQNPINEMFTNSSSGNITYANTGEKAVAIGVEVEYKKTLFELEGENDLNSKLSFGLNASYIDHKQDLDPDKVFRENGFGANFTFDEVKLTGASDVLANADFSYFRELSEDKDIMTTLSYAYFSDKLAVIGTQGLGNMVDKSISRLDFVVKSNLSKSLKLGLSVKNILNQGFERVLEQSKVDGASSDVLVSSYKSGVNISLSLNYKF